jgi:hypothetical protein
VCLSHTLKNMQNGSGMVDPIQVSALPQKMGFPYIVRLWVCSSSQHISVILILIPWCQLSASLMSVLLNSIYVSSKMQCANFALALTNAWYTGTPQTKHIPTSRMVMTFLCNLSNLLMCVTPLFVLVMESVCYINVEYASYARLLTLGEPHSIADVVICI